MHFTVQWVINTKWCHSLYTAIVSVYEYRVTIDCLSICDFIFMSMTHFLLNIQHWNSFLNQCSSFRRMKILYIRIFEENFVLKGAQNFNKRLHKRINNDVYFRLASYVCVQCPYKILFCLNLYVKYGCKNSILKRHVYFFNKYL